MKTLLALALACSVACASPSRFQVGGGSPGTSLEAVFSRVQTSVVTIRTVGKSTEIDRYGRQVSAAGVGSGTLVSEDGRILTAAHVVQTADQVVVEFPTGEAIPAKVMSSLPSADLAMVKLTKPAPKTAKVARLADSDTARVGSEVFVVGAPLGISHTLTVGHLSARRAIPLSPGSDERVELLQTDASINPGNSGGPLFNMNGEVIGVVSHIVTETGGSAGLGFAVTSNVAREQMLSRKLFWSGLDEVGLTGDLAAAFNIPDGQTGMLIQRVAKDSPGERLGLRGGTIPVEIAGQSLLIGGDILLAVLDVPLGTADAHESVRAKVEALEKGDTLSVVILRAGKQIRLEKTLGDLRD